MPEHPIAALVRRTYQRPQVEVIINERRIVRVVSAHVELGYDMAVPTATLTLGTLSPPFWQEHDHIRIDMGYGGAGGLLQVVFIGEVETDSRKYSPRILDVAAAGHSKRLQRPMGNVALVTDPPTPLFTYSNQTDTQIWNDLMRRAGIPRYDAGDGDAITYATLQAYEVQAGTKPADIVSKLDESSKSGQRTFEVAGVVLRRPVLGVPSSNVVWRYAEGVQGLTAPYLPIIEVTRNVTNKDIQNQAIVKGVGVADETDTTPTPVIASMQAVNDKLGKDGDGNDIYVPHSLSSDFLETRDQCTDVARRLMIEYNKETEDVTLRVALNPAIFPGQSIGLISSKMDLPGLRPYWVRHVVHDVGPSGAFTTVQLEGGAGPQGYLLGLNPVAMFEMTVTSETFEVGGVLDTWYTVTADGSTSYDPDGTIASYAWSATNGASGSGQIFTTRFTQAQWDDPDTAITLTVTDADTDPTGPHTNALTQGVVGATGEDDVQIDGIYVAANGQADASADGGLTWGTWVADAGAHVISVTRLSPGLAYYGLDDGRLMLTEDHLATPPTLIHTFPAAVTAVAVSEVDNNKVVIGLQNGDVWTTVDLFETAPLLKRNFTWPIYWINGSIEQITQWRVATGSYVWITYDDFVTVGTLSTQANKIRQIELSNYANYNVEDVDANIKIETVGVSLTYPALSPPPVEAYLAHFLRTDELMVADDQSRVFVKAPDTNALTAVAPVGGGKVNALMAARLNPKVFYAGAADGLYKTYDAGLSWYRVRNYTAAGLDALQLGLDSEPVSLRIVAGIIEFVSVGKTSNPMAGGAPAGGQLIPSVSLVDGTEWSSAMAIRNGWAKTVSYRIDHSTPNAPDATYPNWYLAAFDDSAWLDAEYSWGGYSQELLPRAWMTGPDQRPDNIMQQDSYFLYRHQFAIPANTELYLTATLSVIGYYEIKRMWFNGTQIYGVGSARGDKMAETPIPVVPNRAAPDGLYMFDVSDLIVAGDNNLFAAHVESAATGLVPGHLTYRLMLNTSPVASAVTVGPGAVFVSTIEESRAYDLLDPAAITQYPSGHAGTIYLRPPPDGWTNPSYGDEGWPRPLGTNRWGVIITHDPDSKVISLLNGSQYYSSRFVYPAHGGIGVGFAIRQHWNIPEGEYILAHLSLRWKHTIKAWFNGTLVHQDASDNPAQTIPPAGLEGKESEMLDIDVLTLLVPGGDNVLCLEVSRADSYPAQWFLGDFVGACAILEVQ